MKLKMVRWRNKALRIVNTIDNHNIYIYILAKLFSGLFDLYKQSIPVPLSHITTENIIKFKILLQSLTLHSHGTGPIFGQWKIRVLRRFAHMEPRQT